MAGLTQQRHAPIPPCRHSHRRCSDPNPALLVPLEAECWWNHSGRQVCALYTEQRGGIKTEQNRLQQVVCEGLMLCMAPALLPRTKKKKLCRGWRAAAYPPPLTFTPADATLFAPLSQSRRLRSLRADRLRNSKTVELWWCSGTMQAHWQARLPPVPTLNCTFVLNCTSHLCSHSLLLLRPCPCLFIAFLCAYIFLLSSCRFLIFFLLAFNRDTRAIFVPPPCNSACLAQK